MSGRGLDVRENFVTDRLPYGHTHAHTHTDVTNKKPGAPAKRRRAPGLKEIPYSGRTSATILIFEELNFAQRHNFENKFSFLLWAS